MAPRPLPIGSYGKINTRLTREGTWLARCRFHAHTGEMLHPGRRGLTEDAAVEALRSHLAELVAAGARGELSRETRLSEVADLWIASDIEPDVQIGALSATTHDVYRSVLKRWVIPRLGALRMREVSATAVDQLIRDARTKRSVDTAATVRTVLSGLCTYAVRHGALDANPVKSAKRLRRAKHEVRGIKHMDAGQIADMLRGLRTYGQAQQTDRTGRPVGPRAQVWLDLPELALVMLSTGSRIGEALALTAGDVDAGESGTSVFIDAHVVRVKGRGLIREPGRKGNRPAVRPIVPKWAAPVFAKRALAAPPGGSLFATAEGKLLDPSNTTSRFRAALDDSGFEWVTSHVWRKTVATVLAEAGLSRDEVSAVLGNTADVAERFYMAKPKANPRATAALEDLVRSDWATG